MLENLEPEFFSGLFSGFKLDIISDNFEQDCKVSVLEQALKSSGANTEDIQDFVEALYGSNFSLDIKEALNTNLSSSDIFSVLARGELEIKQLYSLADTFLIKFSNGKSVKIDANLNQIGHKDETFDGALPIKKALRYLDEYIAGNQEPLVLRGTSSTSAFSDPIINLMEAFELNDSVFINEIEILDHLNRPLTSLPFIVPKKRHLAIEVFPHHSEFIDLVRMSKWAAQVKYYFKEQGLTCYYSEAATDILGRRIEGLKSNIRVCSIWEDNKDQPNCILVTKSSGRYGSISVELFKKKY